MRKKNFTNLITCKDVKLIKAKERLNNSRDYLH